MADKKSSVWTSLPMQMMFGLVLGVVVGAFTNPEFAQTWFRPLGDLFIRLIRMVVVPLVFATLVAGAAGISDVSKLGRVAVRTLVLFMVTSAISVVFGLVIANLIDPGVGVTLSTEGLKAAQVNAPSFVKTLLEIVPINPMEAFAKGSILQIIFFAIMFGFCLNAMGEKGRAMYEFFDVMGHIMIRMTNIVMRYAPIGVFGLMAAVVAQHGIAVLLPLGKLILASFIATALLVIIIYIPWVKFWIRIPLGQYFKGIFEPWLIAFTTCSSAAAMAANLVASRRLGERYRRLHGCDCSVRRSDLRSAAYLLGSGDCGSDGCSRRYRYRRCSGRWPDHVDSGLHADWHPAGSRGSDCRRGPCP